MNITIVTVGAPQPVPGKKYQTMEVAYKDQTGKVAGKKLMSFTYPLVFNALKGAQQGDSFEVKNEKIGEYWNWTEAVKVEGGAASVETSTPSKTQAFTQQSNDRYETKEEREKRQVMIVRQSSLSNAVATLAVGGKSALDPSKVIGVAQEYESYVLGKGVQGIIDMESDLPD